MVLIDDAESRDSCCSSVFMNRGTNRGNKLTHNTSFDSKIASSLLYAIRQQRGEEHGMLPHTRVHVDGNGELIVDISANVSDALLSQLRSMGTQILSAFPQYHTIRARVALDLVEAIAANPDILFVQPRQEAMLR